MSRISEKLGYARGILKAMEGNEHADKNLLELLNALCDAADEQASVSRRLEEQFAELDEYVESIDDDLADLEDAVSYLEEKDEDEFFDEDDEDFDDERPLHLIKRRGGGKCGHHHGGDHECRCHEEGHECHCHEEGHVCHCHDDEDDCDCGDEDDELDLDVFDNLFLGVLCPECGHMFCVTDEDFDAPDARYLCPFCQKEVHVSPIDPQNVPVAKRVN